MKDKLTNKVAVSPSVPLNCCAVRGDTEPFLNPAEIYTPSSGLRAEDAAKPSRKLLIGNTAGCVDRPFLFGIGLNAEFGSYDAT